MAKSPQGPLPLYQRIKQHVLTHIRNKDWPPGHQIPSELELCNAFGASRMTVNRALRELTSEGRLSRRQGVGTFVAENRPQVALFSLRSIAEEIAARNGRHDCTEIFKDRITADPTQAADFNLPPGQELFHVLLLHHEDGMPLQVEDRLVNPAVAPNFLTQDFTRLSASDYLLQFLPVSEIEHFVEARPPTAQEGALLQQGAQDPCLVLRRRVWAGRSVVARVDFVHRGAGYRIGGRFNFAEGALL
ncbi:MAG: histidine utilization repressor [Magnetospiraceae bacterium]